MDKLERKHYLKHYLGNPAMVLTMEHAMTGELEEVDMEDGTALIRAGEKSHYVDGDNVTPLLKQFKDITEDDLRTIFSNCIFKDPFDKQNKCSVDGMLYFDYGHMKGFMEAFDRFYIDDRWIPHNALSEPCLNIGTIILLLCELGYDVTGIFKR